MAKRLWEASNHLIEDKSLDNLIQAWQDEDQDN